MMRNVKKTIAVLLLIVVIYTMTGLPEISTALAATSGDYEYVDNGNGTCTITDYIGAGVDVTIPSVLDGLTVTEIGEEAFTYAPSITDIIIPDCVKKIGIQAFASNENLHNVTIGGGVEHIGTAAFLSCWKLGNISLSKNVSYIGTQAFSYCDSMMSIDVDDENLHYKSIDGVLFSKDGTSLLQCPSGKSQTVYTIPGGVLDIGISAFAKCDINNINIPNSVNKILPLAFAYCDNLTSITIPNSVTWVYSYAFTDCSSLVQVIIPASVTSIGDHAFTGCSIELTIYGDAGSYAETYANENGIPFEAIGGSGNNKAIIIVPGIMGSELYYGGTSETLNKVWVYLLPTFYTECNKDGASVYDVFPYSQPGQYGVLDTYKSLYNRLDSEFGSVYDIVFFPYDWRMSNVNSAHELKEVINNYDECVIIAHSMGGLVTSSYLTEYEVEAQEKIDKVITLGTPYLGAPQFLYVMETGYFRDFLKDVCFSNALLKKLAPNFIGANQLLPYNNVAGFSDRIYPSNFEIELYVSTAD